MKKILIFLFVLLLSDGFSQDTINRTDPSGKKQGYWIRKDQEGKKVFEGRFINGKPADTLRYFYPSGAIKAISVFSRDGRKTRTTTFFPNGRKMSEGVYVDEKRDSLWKFYSEFDGALVGDESYTNGIKNGVSRTYYAGNGISELITWKNGVKDGLWEQYYEGGALKVRGTYRNNEKEGDFKTFYSSGKTLYSGQYQNGKAIGNWIYYDTTGRVDKKETYHNGLLIDKWELNPEKE